MLSTHSYTTHFDSVQYNNNEQHQDLGHSFSANCYHTGVHIRKSCLFVSFFSALENHYDHFLLTYQGCLESSHWAR